ncbi:LysR family transcriptional regulator [Neoroseomonas alba]|nr:LysR family transcriptional regulator [Neoroseomonas alba]
MRDLRLVLAISEHGTMVRAARVLRVAQPALTRQLASLESRLRGPLFERTPRGMLPTDLGRTVIAEATVILDRLKQLDSRAAEVRGDQVRDLTIVAGAFMAETLAMVAASRMLALYPRVRVRLNAANWAEVPAALHAREATLGLFDLRSLGEDPAFEVERLRPHPGVFVVRQGHPLLTLDGIGLPDIMAYPMVFIGRVPTEVHAPLAAARAVARQAGWMHPAFPALVHESPTAMLRAAIHSDAIAGTTLSVAAPWLRCGEVAAIRWREPWMSVLPGIVRLRNAPMPEAETAFLDLLRAADREAADEAEAWCAAQGLSAACA